MLQSFNCVTTLDIKYTRYKISYKNNIIYCQKSENKSLLVFVKFCSLFVYKIDFFSTLYSLLSLYNYNFRKKKIFFNLFLSFFKLFYTLFLLCFHKQFSFYYVSTNNSLHTIYYKQFLQRSHKQLSLYHVRTNNSLSTIFLRTIFFLSNNVSLLRSHK